MKTTICSTVDISSRHKSGKSMVWLSYGSTRVPALSLHSAPKPRPLLSNLYPLHSSCPACGAVIGVSWVQCTQQSHPASNRQTLQNSRCFVGVATTLWAGGSWLHLGHNKRGQDEGSGGGREEVWPRKTWECPLCLSLPLSGPESCSQRPI